MDNSTRLISVYNGLNVSGVLQSPLTSLLSVSSGVIDWRVGTIIGVSIPQFLTRNETILPSTFTNFTSLTGSGNLTISGTLQSFQTSLLATSSSVIDGKISSQIGISNVNLDNRINLLGASSSVMDGKIGTIIGSFNSSVFNKKWDYYTFFIFSLGEWLYNR